MNDHYTDVTFKSAEQSRNELKLSESKQLLAIVERILELKTNMVNDYLEIGDLLLKAKERIPHGEWEHWLKSKVRISPRHARTIMKTASLYLPEKRSLYTGLSFSKLLELSSLEEAEREEFIALHDCENISATAIKSFLSEEQRTNHKALAEEQELFRQTVENDLLDLDDLGGFAEEIHEENLHLLEENKLLQVKVEALEEKVYGAGEAKGIIDELQYLTEELETNRGEFTLKLYNNVEVLKPYRSFLEGKIRLLSEWQDLLQFALEGGRNGSI